MVALSMPLPAAAAPARPPRRASAGRRVRRIGLRADAISEVAMRCARHDGLCSFEGDAGSEHLEERAVAIDRQQGAALAEADRKSDGEGKGVTVRVELGGCE